MTDKVKHFLLTRFNVAFWAESRRFAYVAAGLRDVSTSFVSTACRAWQRRLDKILSELFSLTSRRRINTGARSLTSKGVYSFRAEFTGLFEMDKIAPQIMSSIEDADWMLTTCLDSDDILAVDPVARLREALIPARRQVINFLDGVILSIVDAQPRLYIVRDNASPFASLMEPRPSLSGARNMSLSSASRQSCN